MKIHCIQHVEFETIGTIAQWSEKKGHSLSSTHLYADDSIPSLDNFDLLIIMGGPMNIYEHEKYPWLIEEKSLSKKPSLSEKQYSGFLGSSACR